VPTVSEVGKEGNAQKLNREALCLGRSVLCLCGRWCLVLKVGRGRLSVQARLAVQEGVFLDRAAGARLLADAVVSVQAVRRGRGDVRNLFGVGVLATDLGDADVAGLACLGEGVVAAVKVLALLRATIRRRA
jgi:hypothetical protein